MSELFNDKEIVELKAWWVAPHNRKFIDSAVGIHACRDVDRLIATVEALRTTVSDKIGTIEIQGKMLRERDDLKLDPGYIKLREEMAGLKEERNTLSRKLNQAKSRREFLLEDRIKELEHCTFQGRVYPWLILCFGEKIADDSIERNHRFLEESLELVQSCGCTKSEAVQLVDYVFDRLVGEKKQETGGVMVTLAALCLAQKIDMHKCGETELHRILGKVDEIRAKQAAKPKHSPLPAPPKSTT